MISTWSLENSEKMPDPSIQHEILRMLSVSIHWIQLVVGTQNQVHLVEIKGMATVALLYQLRKEQDKTNIIINKHKLQCEIADVFAGSFLNCVNVTCILFHNNY